MCFGAETAYYLLVAASAARNAQAQKAQSNYQAQIAENNAQVAERQAVDAIQRGNEASLEENRRGQQTMGTQRAAMAAAGLDVSTGSALSIVEDTSYFSQVDQQTIKDNAAREAWGYRVQGSNALASAGLYHRTADGINPLFEGAVAGAGAYYKSGGGKRGSDGRTLLSSGSAVNPKWYSSPGANATRYSGEPDISTYG